MPLSAAGIAIIFGIAVWEYGVFHLADYPIFLGIAVYLALTGLQRDLFGVQRARRRALERRRHLMWASIEKWAYPEWSYPLFVTHPEMTMGFSPDFFMRAAGAVEFALAFSLMWTPLVRRIGAIMLAAMFVSAVFEFGKVDLIGHSLIVVVLLAIVADNRAAGLTVPRHQWLIPVAYAAALAAVFGRLLRGARVAVRHVAHLTAERNLLDVHDELHFWVDGAKHVEVAGDRKRDVGLAARLLVAGVEFEIVGIDIGMMPQVGVIVDDRDRFAALEVRSPG